MSESLSNLSRAASIDSDVQKNFDFFSLNKILEKQLFQAHDNQEQSQHMIELNRYYFYQYPDQKRIQNPTIVHTLDQIRQIIGNKIFRRIENIQSQISERKLNSVYLKYLYGILNLPSLQEKNIPRSLIWIYSLCYGKYTQESSLLRDTLNQDLTLLIRFGLEIIYAQKGEKQSKISEIESSSRRKIQRKFKDAMHQFISRIQQIRNHEEAYQICRICEKHISVNLMHAHLALCESVYEKNYLQQNIEESGREILETLVKEKIQYDYLDARADTRLFFNRVFSSFGDKTVIFQIKEDQVEMLEVIQQFQDHPNEMIRKTVKFLEKYYAILTSKPYISGYQSDQGVKKSTKKKLKSSRLISRNSIKFSCNSINLDSQSKNSSTGSQKKIRYIDDGMNFKSAKSFYSLQDFQILKLLGKGAYSQVYLVRNVNTSDLFAMKVVQVENVDAETLETLKKQQEIYKTISSEFAIKLFYSFAEQNLHFFLLQYASGGNLRSLLQEQVYLQQDAAKIYLANLILAIQQIHQMKILHRDLKPQNIVIDESGFLKLTDFNLAFLLTAHNEQNDHNEKFFGSPDYIAPQVINSTLQHHPSRDIWSLGIIAYEILIGVTPFTAMQVQQVFQNVLKGQIDWPQIGQQEGMISANAKDFIAKLLEPDPYKRLGFNSISELKSHPFFGGINWQNIRKHSPYLIPKKTNKQLRQNSYLKQKILQRKTSRNSLNVPSLGCIIRYDVLKSKSSLQARSTRKSRFKLQKQLNQLKILTSMDSFPPCDLESERQLQSTQSVTQTEHSHPSHQLKEISFRSIQEQTQHQTIEEEQEYDSKN